jgi:hypothetical protein
LFQAKTGRTPFTQDTGSPSWSEVRRLRGWSRVCRCPCHGSGHIRREGGRVRRRVCRWIGWPLSFQRTGRLVGRWRSHRGWRCVGSGWIFDGGGRVRRCGGCVRRCGGCVCRLQCGSRALRRCERILHLRLEGCPEIAVPLDSLLQACTKRIFQWHPRFLGR